MAKPKQTRIVCRELAALVPKKGAVPDEVEVGSLTLTGEQAATMARMFVGEAPLTIQKLPHQKRVAARTKWAPTGIWWVFDANGTYKGVK